MMKDAIRTIRMLVGWDRPRAWRRLMGLAMILAVAGAAMGVKECPYDYQGGQYAAVEGNRIKILDSHYLRYFQKGEGGPTVIFESGEGIQLSMWGHVQDAVAQFTNTLSYDRSGVGISQAGPQPRDAATAVKELRDLLDKLDLDPPYIICSHSLGGLFTRFYAYMYPEEIAGLILLDTRHEEFEYELFRYIGYTAAADMIEFDTLDSSLLRPGPKDEWEDRHYTYAEVRDARQDLQEAKAGPILDIPIRVLRAGKSSFTRVLNAEHHAAYLEFEELLQNDIASDSADSTVTLLPNSSHMVFLDEPQAVIDAIQEVYNLVAKK